MKTMKFSTNINCENCVKAVTPVLNNAENIDHWEVNTENPDKILTVKGSVDEDVVRKIVSAAGYDVIERLDKKENE